MQADLILKDCRQLVTLRGGAEPRTVSAMSDPGIIAGGALAVKDGRILAVSTTAEIMAAYSAPEVVSADDKLVLPGFVDCHTHPVFVHTREDEFALRLEGKSYVEISLAGGGIRGTIRTTRDASEDLLFELAAKRIRKMIALGATTVEAKSGYGLDTASELKQLRVIARLTARARASCIR